MKECDETCDAAKLQNKANRAQWILYILMFVLMALPLVALWWSGALRFE